MILCFLLLQPLGWHEHDPIDLLDSVYDCLEGAVEELEKLGYKASDVKALGITNQRETTLLWDRETGEPMCNAMVWDDARTTGVVHRFQKRLDEEGVVLVGEDLDLTLKSMETDAKGRKVIKGTKGLKELYVWHLRSLREMD